MTANLIDLYREGAARQLAELPWAAAATSNVRYRAWRHVRNELSWGIAYDVAHDRTPARDEVAAWLKISEHMHVIAQVSANRRERRDLAAIEQNARAVCE